MNALWVSDLAPRGPGFAPAVLATWQTFTAPRPPIEWAITRAASPRAKALGAIANASAEQIAALDATSGAVAFEIAPGWRALTWASLHPAARNRISNTLAGGGFAPANGDTLDNVLGQMLASLDDSTYAGLTATQALARFEAALGVTL